MNLILQSDSYKVSHNKLYKDGVNVVYSYLESRGGVYPRTLFFGLQYYLKKYLQGGVITKANVDEAEIFWNKHFGRVDCFDRNKWDYIVNIHGGKLPIRIQAIPEGTVTKNGTVLMTIENTDPRCFWLTNFLETLIMKIWYPTTIATQSFYIKEQMLSDLEKSGDPNSISFKVHDFGYRGVSSEETAAIGAASHLLSFCGTDTVAGVKMLMDYYNSDMCGFSIPATEHSIMCSFGRDGELAAMENLLDRFPIGLIACVSDTYDIYNACESYWGDKLKDKILNRDGCLVVRPDCYDEQTEILTENGWTYFKDLNKKELVAQYDLQGGISFTKPNNYVEQYYDGEMIKFSDKKGRLDLLVTPNHRIPVDTKKGIKIVEAKDCKFNTNKNLIRAGKKYLTTNSKSLTFLERLYIAFQADGSFQSKFNGKRGKKELSIRFNFIKTRKVNRLIDICKMGNFKYKISIEGGRPKNTQVYVWLDHVPSKTFDWVNFKNIDSDWCREFVEELSYWDATRRTATRFKYDSTKEINTHIIQAICALGGYGCTYSIHKDNRKEQFSDVHSLSILTNKNKIGGRDIKLTKEYYKGNIYCVTVPSGMIVVRRNKKVCISGNSGDYFEVVPKILDILYKKLGGNVNDKGYKVLDPHVRVIQGDGMNPDSIRKLYSHIMNLGWSADNLAVGSGGGLLQSVNRDTNKFAIKASAALLGNDWIDIYKEPITDPGKRSKTGRFQTILRNKEIYSVDFHYNQPGAVNLLETVFLNGEVRKEYELEQIKLNIETSKHYA